MKNLKKIHLFKARVLLVAFLFLAIIGCQKEDAIVVENQEDTITLTQSQLIFKDGIDPTVSENTTLNNTLNTLFPNQNSTSLGKSTEVYNANLDFTINTNIANYIEYGTYQSYTFPITRTVDNGLLENVLLSLQPGDSYKAFLVTYNLTDVERQTLLDGGDVDLTGKITSTLIEQDWVDANFTSKTNSSACISIDTSTIYYCEDANGNTIVDNGQVGNGCMQNYHSESITYIIIDWACASSGGSGSPNGPGQGPGNSDPRGDGSDGGSSGDNSNSNNDLPLDGKALTKPMVIDTDSILSDCLGLNNSAYYNTSLLSSILSLDSELKALMAKLIGYNGCTQQSADLLDELIDFLADENYSAYAVEEAKIRLHKEEADLTNGWDMSVTGIYENREGLNYIGVYNSPNLNGTMFLLENHDVLFATQTPRIISQQDSFIFQTTISSNEEEIYHYIYKQETKRWYNAIMPQPSFDCLSCHLEDFFQAVLQNGGIILGRYVLPVEDVYIVVTGEDFDGAESSRALAAGFILVDIIPGTQALKLIKAVKYGDEAIEAATTVIKRFDELLDQIGQAQKQIIDNVLGDVDWYELDLFDNTVRKGNFGEMVTDVDLSIKGYEPLHTRVDYIDKPLNQGIDGVFQNPQTGEYIIVETKFGQSNLSPSTATGPQMSETWIEARIIDEVGEELAEEILEDYISVLAKVNQHGEVTYYLLDSNGQVVGIWNP